MPSPKTAKEPTPFIVLDLKHLSPGRGIAVAGLPYQICTDGNPTGGTYSGQLGERVMLLTCDDAEFGCYLQRLWTGKCKCFRQNGEGNWIAWTPPEGVLDFARSDWSGWKAIRVEGKDFTTDWLNADGTTYSAGSSAE